MSTSLLGLLVAVLVSAPDVTAVEPEPRDTTYGPNLLLANPADLLGGAVSVEYERALTPWFGLTAGVSVWSFRGDLVPVGTPSFTSLSPELGARFHFVRDAPGGLWVGPMISGGYLFARNVGALVRTWSWGLGAAVGYNFIIGHHFTVQLGAGAGFVDYGDLLAWAPRLRLGVGWAF